MSKPEERDDWSDILTEMEAVDCVLWDPINARGLLRETRRALVMTERQAANFDLVRQYREERDDLRQAVKLLNSMILCGEKHSVESTEMVRKAMHRD